MSIRKYPGLLVCLLVATGSLLSGCDSSGSNSDAPEWTGDWKFVENFEGETPQPPVFITYTEDASLTYVPTQVGCEITHSDIIGIEGEKVTFEIPGSGDTIPGTNTSIPGNNVRTERLTVSNDTLTLEVTRSNLSDTLAQAGKVSKAVPVDENPRQTLGCEKSSTTKNNVSLYRRLR